MEYIKVSIYIILELFEVIQQSLRWNYQEELYEILKSEKSS